jgi:hypothetical protein
MRSHVKYFSNLNNHASGGKHGNTAVLDLSLASPVQVQPVREAKRVEADVADHGAIQILWPLSSRDGINTKTLEHTLLPQLHLRAPRNSRSCFRKINNLI